MRKTAFPFDWIVSLDGEGLIKILEDNFEHFLSDQYFTPYGPAGHLLQTYYHLEFLHDGNFNGEQYFSNIEKLKTKYQRRIERFRELRNYPGKVFFIRTAYIYSVTDPNRYYKFQDNIEITDEYSLRLYNSIKNFFPNLNFSLIIVNNDICQDIQEEHKLSKNLLMIRDNPLQDQSAQVAAYKKFFIKLMEDK